MDIAKGECKSAELSIVIIRADGTKEDLGVVARYDSDPLKQAIQKVKNLIKTVTS